MKKSLTIFALALLFLLSACGSQGQIASSGSASPSGSTQKTSAQVTKLTAEEAHERITSGAGIVVVDVRTAEEYAQGHIPGALLIPNEEIGTQPPAALPVMSAEILIYCRSGNRSAQAAQKFVDMGYTNVSDFGGINDWSYETESGAYQAPVKEGTLSSFVAYDLAGEAVDESIFANHKLTMVNIWATFCGPCLGEMPELGQLAVDYADRGVQIVGIVADVPRQTNGVFDPDMVATAQTLVNQTGANYLHLLPSDDLIVAKLGQVTAVPETIFVDSTGKQVGQSYLGSRSGADWAKIIDALLSEAAS